MSMVLDAQVLDELAECIGGEAAQAVIELFIEECRDLFAAMAAPGADLPSIGRAAHSLKSSAGQLGAVALSEAAVAVESAAGTASADLPRLVAVLGECAAIVTDALGARLRA